MKLQPVIVARLFEMRVLHCLQSILFCCNCFSEFKLRGDQAQESAARARSFVVFRLVWVTFSLFTSLSLLTSLSRALSLYMLISLYNHIPLYKLILRSLCLYKLIPLYMLIPRSLSSHAYPALSLHAYPAFSVFTILSRGLCLNKLIPCSLALHAYPALLSLQSYPALSVCTCLTLFKILPLAVFTSLPRLYLYNLIPLF